MKNLNTKEVSNLKQLISNFSLYFNDIKNKPCKDSYGTKRDGNLHFEHFILYALIRGSNPSKTTHSTTSENYISALKQVNYIRKLDLSKIELSYKYLFTPFIGKNLTIENVVNILNY
jgi:hypothetical protein